MKPCKVCPGCAGPLKNHQANYTWFEQNCRRCHLEYHQYFDKSFEDEELSYVSFYTEHFHVYVYYEKGPFPNTAHIYSRAEQETRTVTSPIIMMPSDKVDIFHIEELDRKLETLALFS